MRVVDNTRMLDKYAGQKLHIEAQSMVARAGGGDQNAAWPIPTTHIPHKF